MGISHEHRPYVSRRQFLARAGVLGAGLAAGPWFWQRLAYAADVPVQHLHATWGADAARSATVSWTTPEPVTQPFVSIGGRRVYAETAQYAGYPGYLHHATLTDLDPSTSYTYGAGHADAVVLGDVPLRTGPSGREAFTFTAFGDQGVDVSDAVPPVSQPPNQASANTALAASFDPAFHLIVGDLAYANGDQAIWDQWFDMVSPMARSKPWMPCIGNHEAEGDAWGEWGYDAYRSRFLLPPNGSARFAQCFYAFRYGSVQFVSIDNNDVTAEATPNVGYTEGAQMAFVERTLAAARRDPAVDFVVVLMHHSAFSSSSKHGSDDGVREAWLPLFAQHSVDLVLQGHDHTYERMHPLRDEQVVATELPARTDAGTVYVVCGNGGAVQEPFAPVQPEWSAMRQELKVGTLRIEVEPFAANGMARLTLGEFWALDGSPIDEGIVLERPSRAATEPAETAAPAPPPATPTKPSVTLPSTGGPAGAALVGVAAAGAGVALRYLTREESRDLSA